MADTVSVSALYQAKGTDKQSLFLHWLFQKSWPSVQMKLGVFMVLKISKASGKEISFICIKTGERDKDKRMSWPLDGIDNDL
jgi:hypothetical protein